MGFQKWNTPILNVSHILHCKVSDTQFLLVFVPKKFPLKIWPPVSSKNKPKSWMYTYNLNCIFFFYGDVFCTCMAGLTAYQRIQYLHKLCLSSEEERDKHFHWKVLILYTSEAFLYFLLSTCKRISCIFFFYHLQTTFNPHNLTNNRASFIIPLRHHKWCW